MGRSTAPCAAGERDRIGVVPTNGFQNRVREVGHGRASSCEADRIETRNWSKQGCRQWAKASTSSCHHHGAAAVNELSSIPFEDSAQTKNNRGR